MDLFARSVDTLMNRIQIRAEKSTRLCFNLYFVSICAFTNLLLLAAFLSPILFPFFFAAIAITTVEALWGHPQGMKKASVSGTGRLQNSSDQYGSLLNYK